MSDILSVKNLSVFFKSSSGGEDIKAVDNVSFDVKENEILGIVGESGSGKSVTSLSILQLLPYPKAYHSNDSLIEFANLNLCKTSKKNIESVRGKDISMIFQEPMSSLNPLHPIGRQIAEIMLVHGCCDKVTVKGKVISLLEMTGIDNAEDKYHSYPHELSGGQKQRVMIAMAIANNPKLLIADEPTTALDVTVQEQILDLLKELKAKTKMSIIFVSHDLNVIRKIADRVCVMYQGKIVEQGAVEAIFNNPQHCYTKQLISSAKLEVKDCAVNKDEIYRLDNIHVVYPLRKNFFGKVVKSINAVDGISFGLNRCETLGIVGESGSGKTTLGMVASNLIKYEGDVYIEGKKIDVSSNVKSKDFRKKLQIIFQDPYNSLNPRMTIEEIIGEGLAVHFSRLSKSDKTNRIHQVLKDVGLPLNVLNKYPHEFSGGQRQRIAIARSLVVEPEIIILDEPTSALDVTVQKQIILLLKKLQQDKGLSYIFISHDMNVIRSICDRVMVVKSGKIVELDSNHNIFSSPKDPYTQELISASF